VVARTVVAVVIVASVVARNAVIIVASFVIRTVANFVVAKVAFALPYFLNCQEMLALTCLLEFYGQGRLTIIHDVAR
jgi:DNA integrity scanning protein DisA with diadenylate cyclase activity